MKFKNEKHRECFTNATKKLNKKNKELMSAVYLLTADFSLWNQTKKYVEPNKVPFDAIRLKGNSENAYTLFCVAKDLCVGTKHISVSDLADSTLISPVIFELICNAMAIRRFGLGAISVNTNNQGEC